MIGQTSPERPSPHASRRLVSSTPVRPADDGPDPVISVIVPSYQHAAFVGKAIESVLGQSCGDLELLITDDGSQDDSVEKIREFKDARIGLEVFEENRGASAAINAALRRARGEFVCFLNSDDYFLPDKLEVQLKFMRENRSVGGLFGLPLFVNERGEALERQAPRAWYDSFDAPLRERLRSRADWLRRFFLKGNCLCQPTAMVRRSVLIEVGGYNERLANLPDFDLWVRICLRHPIQMMDTEVTGMRILDDSRNMSAPRTDTRLRSGAETFQILKRYRELSPDSVRLIFERDIAAHPSLAKADDATLLAEVALTLSRPPQQLFGLDTMFEASELDTSHLQRLIELTGSVDPFGLRARRDSITLKEQLVSARAEIARLAAELEAAGHGTANAPSEPGNAS